jgi:hypothetical protein
VASTPQSGEYAMRRREPYDPFVILGSATFCLLIQVLLRTGGVIQLPVIVAKPLFLASIPT